MERLLYPLFVLASQWYSPIYNGRIRILEAQIRMLRSRIAGARIVPSPEERSELLRLGEEIDHDIGEVLHIVRPKTYRRWLRERRRGLRPKLSGRPGLPFAVRHLVLRMALGKRQWGYRRIVGEIRKLGIFIGATTVRTILRDAGITPGPEPIPRAQPVPWHTFIQANLDSIVACDFFTKRVYTIHGILTAYILVFVHLGSRRVYNSSATISPNAAWVMQQARNATMWMEDEGIKTRFVLHDRDRKYPDKFREFWKSEGIKRVRTPIQAPKANAYCESFIGTLKRECLNHLICFSRQQLDYAVHTWVRYYNTERPHRGVGIDNNVLDPTFQPRSVGTIRCKKELGGLITSYYREAA